GIPLDAATPGIFQQIKGEGSGGFYQWDTHRKALQDAMIILGKGRVTTHLIVGLGETEEEMCNTIQELTNEGIRVGLFAFTPVLGSGLANREPPSYSQYWKIQLARHLIQKKGKHVSSFLFKNGKLKSFGISKKELIKEIEKGIAFFTSGCPKCNRPYYNERPGKTLYNFPRPIMLKEISLIKETILTYLE
ncbi:MAG: radical SAM protein, partial [Candidatus Hodarchaeota archaeon]